jgi:CheY-like chemotaxis protein
MNRRHHITFIEDDEAEMTTFRRLYEGDQFELTGVCIQSPRSALPIISEALGERVPDLFVLDLFFPATSNPPGGFTPDTVDDARLQLTRVLRAAGELEGMFLDESALAKNDKELLRAGSELVYWSQRMLRRWCDVLGQSPSGGIALMRILREKYPAVPAVFYSRKAMVADVKAALEAGALDVLIKPHRLLEDAEAAAIRETLARYCEGLGPGWRKVPENLEMTRPARGRPPRRGRRP